MLFDGQNAPIKTCLQVFRDLGIRLWAVEEAGRLTEQFLKGITGQLYKGMVGVADGGAGGSVAGIGHDDTFFEMVQCPLKKGRRNIRIGFIPIGF